MAQLSAMMMETSQKQNFARDCTMGKMLRGGLGQKEFEAQIPQGLKEGLNEGQEKDAFVGMRVFCDAFKGMGLKKVKGYWVKLIAMARAYRNAHGKLSECMAEDIKGITKDIQYKDIMESFHLITKKIGSPNKWLDILITMSKGHTMYLITHEGKKEMEAFAETQKVLQQLRKVAVAVEKHAFIEGQNICIWDAMKFIISTYYELDTFIDMEHPRWNIPRMTDVSVERTDADNTRVLDSLEAIATICDVTMHQLAMYLRYEYERDNIIGGGSFEVKKEVIQEWLEQNPC